MRIAQAVLVAVLIATATIVVKQVPDIQRYMKMRSM